MKTILHFGIFMLTIHGIFGQKIGPLLFSSSGGFNSNGTVKIHYAIGETMVSSLSNGIVLSQGFYQGNIIKTGIKNDFLDVDLMISPNPTLEDIQINYNSTSTMSGVVIDVNGRIVKDLGNITSGERIDVTPLIAGQYYLRIQNTNGSFQTVRLIKF